MNNTSTISTDEKKEYIYTHINLLQHDDKVNVLNMILNHDIQEKKIKEVGIGTIIPFSILNEIIINDIYNFIESRIKNDLF